jgi:hypothetical protein
MFRTKDSDYNFRAKLPEARYEEPTQAVQVDITSAMEGDVSTMRTVDIKKAILQLRAKMQLSERNLQKLRAKQSGADGVTNALKEQLSRLMLQKEKYQQLYTKEVQKKLVRTTQDSKAVIESQKRVIDKQFFMTSIPSRPSTTGLRPTTTYSQQTRGLKESSLTEIVRASQNPTTLRGVSRK